MLEYISHFIKEYKFSQDCIYYIENESKKLGSQLELFEKKRNEYTQDYKSFDFVQNEQDLKEIANKTGINEHTTYLLFFIFLTQALKHHFENNNISKNIFKNTVIDLRYKTDECKTRLGIWGLARPSWYARLFTLQIFSLGRLQFEPKELDRDICQNGIVLKKGATVLNVHIPSSGKLLKEDCIASFNLAKDFFKNTATTIDGDKIAFICNTWLLFPRNREYLNEKSSIIMFMDFFTVYDVVEQDEFLDSWRIFGKSFSNDIVPTTSLQKEVYDFLSAGNKLGEAKGFFVL